MDANEKKKIKIERETNNGHQKVDANNESESACAVWESGSRIFSLPFHSRLVRADACGWLEKYGRLSGSR